MQIGILAEAESLFFASLAFHPRLPCPGATGRKSASAGCSHEEKVIVTAGGDRRGSGSCLASSPLPPESGTIEGPALSVATLAPRPPPKQSGP